MTASKTPRRSGQDADSRRRLVEDVESLVSLDRRTTTAGERTSATVIAARLQELGCQEVRLEAFKTVDSWVPPHLVHVAAGTFAAMSSSRVARLGALGVALSYELDASGRHPWVRTAMPQRSGTSVTARVPAPGAKKRTVVLVAHHDAAHTGLIWQRTGVALSQALARRTRRSLPTHLPALAGIIMAAVPTRPVRQAAAVTLLGSAVLMLQAMRSPSTPGANDNASGVAAVLEVTRRLINDPVEGVEVLIVIPGGEEVGNAGMRSWLTAHHAELDPEHTLVVNLDAVGSNGPLAVAEREGLTTSMGKPEVQLALETAQSLNVRLERLGIPNATDAVISTQAGIPTISLLSCENGWISHLHRASDTVENLRWETVEDAVDLTEQLTRSWDLARPGQARADREPCHA